MLLGENILLAVRSLLSNKMRALLTMLGIIIGIGSVIAIVTVGNSLTKSVSENMQSIGANDVYVSVMKKSEDTKKQESENSSLDGIQYGSFSTESDTKMTDEDYITKDMIHGMAKKFKDKIYAVNVYHTVGNGKAKREDFSSNVNVIGSSVGYFVTNPLSFKAGGMFSSSDYTQKRAVCLISTDTADELFGGEYENAVGNTMDVEVAKKSVSYTIVGVYKKEEQSSMMYTFGNAASNLYLPLQTAQDLDHSANQYSMFQVSTKVGTDTDELADELTEYFKPYYKNNSTYQVKAVTLESMVSMLTNLLNTITLAISIIAGIALLVGGIGVMNIMLVSVTERTREIGTRKALGAKNSSIRAQFIVEAMIICLIGGIIGIVLGMAGGIAASNYLGYPARPSITGILVSLIFSMSIGLFFGYFPANKAAKMNPIDALRYE